VHIAQVLRRHMLEVHRQGAALNQHATKAMEVYRFIASPQFGALLRDADALTEQLRQIDGRERDGHERTWKARELCHTRLKTVLGDIDTQVTAIVHRPDVGARTGTGD
jgi:hypothetical protein